MLTVYLQVQEEEFFQHLEVKHEFIKKLHHRYKEEGIKISYPLQWGYFSPLERNSFLKNDERF
jgi:small-conductance mechanosensitive channel